MGRILITGGAGFIGCHLATRLASEQSVEIDLVDNFTRGRYDDEVRRLEKDKRVRLRTVELTDPAAVSALGGPYDEVYHLAGMLGVRNVVERSADVLRTNVLSTLFLLDWFVKSGSAKLLFASTSEVYAWSQMWDPLPIPTPEDVPLALTDLENPRSVYAGSKIVGELAVVRYCRAFDKRYTIVRYHNVYGPRMGFDHVIPQLYERAFRGQDPLAVFSPQHSRAFCYITDAVEGTIAAMRQPAGDDQTFNIGNDGEEIEIAELARRLLTQAGLDVAIRPEPNSADQIQRRCPDISRARTLLDYEPRTGLDEGLRQTIKWYRECLHA